MASGDRQRQRLRQPHLTHSQLTNIENAKAFAAQSKITSVATVSAAANSIAILAWLLLANTEKGF